MSFPEDFYAFIKENTLIEIKGGTQRDRFLSIWIVTVNGRVFSRSWNKSEQSWFTAFLDEGVGLIKFGDQVINVTGQKVEPQTDLTHLINQAYLTKYNQEHNLVYAKGITQPEYAGYTMEFFYTSFATG